MPKKTKTKEEAPKKRSYPVPKTKKEKSCHKKAVESGFEKFKGEFKGRQLVAVVLSNANRQCIKKKKKTTKKK